MFVNGGGMGMDNHAFGYRHGTTGDRFRRFFHFVQTDAAISFNDQTWMVAKNRLNQAVVLPAK
jgi:hypothetical protein